MSGDAVIAGLAILSLPLAGAPGAWLLGLRGALFPAAAWLLGCGQVSLLLMAASALQVSYSRPVLALCWLMATALPALLAALVARRPSAPREGRPPSLDAPTAIAIAPGVLICAFQVAYCTLQALRVPLGSFDAWSLWEYKGRLFWLDGGLTAGFLHDRAAIFAHPAYPPLLSLLIAWVYTWAGSADPAPMKALFPCFFLALLLGFHAALRPRVGPFAAVTATAVLSLVPRLAQYAGSGLADVPLAAALVAAAAAFTSRHERGDRRGLLTAGALLGVALLLKRDAIPFALGGLTAAALVTRSWRAALQLAIPAGLIAAPWYGYVWLTAVPDRDFLRLGVRNLVDHHSRLGEIARLFSLNLLAADEWGILWYGFLTLLALGLIRRRMRAAALLLPVAVPLLLFVLALSLSAWPEYTLHVRTSLDRLIMVTAPFALWFCAEQLVAAAP